jgi:hypothetical protein
MHMQTIRRFVVAALIPLALSASALAAQDTEAFSWNGTLAEGRTVHLHNVNGEVRFEVGSGNAVQVRAQKRWRRGDPANVRIEARALANGDVLVCAMWRERDTCTEGGIETRGRTTTWDERNDVSVEFIVTVPAHSNVEVSTINGDVEVKELRGNVQANTVNGDVEASSSGGPVEARTVNGSIRARGQISANGLDYSTVNGSIELALPQNSNADIDFSTVNGRVTSDFPITFSGEINPRRIRAKLGNGGPSLRARTVNGGIRLVRQ